MRFGSAAQPIDFTGVIGNAALSSGPDATSDFSGGDAQSFFGNALVAGTSVASSEGAATTTSDELPVNSTDLSQEAPLQSAAAPEDVEGPGPQVSTVEEAESTATTRLESELEGGPTGAASVTETGLIAETEQDQVAPVAGGAPLEGEGKAQTSAPPLVTMAPAVAGTGFTPAPSGGPVSWGPVPLPIRLSPVPLDQDNPAVLRGLIRDSISGVVQDIYLAAEMRITDAAGRAEQLKAQIETWAVEALDNAASGLGQAARTALTTYMKSQERVRQAVTAAHTRLDVAGLRAMAALQLEYQNQKTFAEGEIDRQAAEIVTYSRLKAAQLRTDGSDRSRRAREIADEVYADYRHHEDAADVRQALDKLATEAARRFDTDSQDAASTVEGIGSLMASQWRAEMPARVSALDMALAQALADVLQAVTTAHGDLDAAVEPLISDIESGLETVTAGLDENAAAFVERLLQERAVAKDQIDLGLATFQTAVLNETAVATESLNAVPDAVDPFVEQLQDEVGNLFCPQDLQPLLEQVTSMAMQAWAISLNDARGQFDNQCSQAETRFRDNLAIVARGGVGPVCTEAQTRTGATSSTSGALGIDIEAKAAECEASIIAAQATSMLALSTMAFRVSADMALSVQTGTAKVDQTVFEHRALENDALHALRGAMRNAAEYEIKPWYEKAWDWVVDVVSSILSAVGNFLWGVWQFVANLLWGFIWGDPWYPDAWGAGVASFIGDIIAGILVYGDVRDLYKWGIHKPLIDGEGYGPMNFVVMGLALFGIVPLFGDIAKIIGKGAIKALVKSLGEKLAERLIREGLEEAGERLVREVGEEVAGRMARELGEDVFVALVKELGDEAVARMVRELGTDAFVALAKELSPTLLKETFEAVGAQVLKQLSERVGGRLLNEVIGELGTQATKDLVERGGAAALRELVDELGTTGTKALVDRLGAAAVGDLVQDMGARGVKALVDRVGVDGVEEVLEQRLRETAQETAERAAHQETVEQTAERAVGEAAPVSATIPPEKTTGWKDVEPFIGKDVKDGVPNGYRVYERRGKKFIRRIVADDELPRLTIENGKIKLGKPTRISKPGELAKELGERPLRHEAHHVVPDEIVRDHPLFKQARKHGYNVDRSSNGAYLPKDAAARAEFPASAHLPLHSGSHPAYNEVARDLANRVLTDLMEEFPGKTLDQIPAARILDAAGEVETIMRDVLEQWGNKLN